MAKPRIKHNTWVVAADGGRALVMRNEGDAEFPRLAVLRTYGEASGQGGPAGPQARSDEETGRPRGEDRLMRELAGDLLAGLRKGEFSSLIIAAAPIALGELRRQMHEELKPAILAEVDKDLTKMPVPEIAAALAKALE
ncbi:MAG: host attachment protein [Hyphomicrobiales bacterium]